MIVQSVLLVLDIFLTGCELCVMYITSADCVNFISGNCAVVYVVLTSTILLAVPPEVYVVNAVLLILVPSTSVNSKVFVVLFATIPVTPLSSTIPATLPIIT